MDWNCYCPTQNSQAGIVSSQALHGVQLATPAQIEPVAIGPQSLRLPAEFELLLACSQPVDDREPGLGSILALPLDWDRVLRVADHHRLIPALHLALGGRDDVPASVRSAICARFQNHERRALRFAAELARILHQFDQHGIQVWPDKGAALAAFLYGDLATRQFGDLDFLVRAGDVARARLVLKQLGYTPKLQLSSRQEKEYLRSGYEYGLPAPTRTSTVPSASPTEGPRPDAERPSPCIAESARGN